MPGKEVLQNLVYLDEVCKRIESEGPLPEDLKFKRELIQRLRDYEKQRGTDLQDLIDLAERGEFCPILTEKLRQG